MIRIIATGRKRFWTDIACPICPFGGEQVSMRSLEFPYRLDNGVGDLGPYCCGFSKVFRLRFIGPVGRKRELIECDQNVRPFAWKNEHSFMSCIHFPPDHDGQDKGVLYLRVQRLDKSFIELFNGFTEFALGDIGF